MRRLESIRTNMRTVGRRNVCLQRNKSQLRQHTMTIASLVFGKCNDDNDLWSKSVSQSQCCVVSHEEPHLASMRDTENVKLQPSQRRERWKKTQQQQVSFAISRDLSCDCHDNKLHQTDLWWVTSISHCQLIKSMTYRLQKLSASSSIFWNLAQSYGKCNPNVSTASLIGQE